MHITKLFILILLASMSNCKDDMRLNVVTNIIDNIECKMKKNNMKIIGVGEGLNHQNDKQNFFKIVFEVDSIPSIEKGRDLFLNTLEEIYYEINNQKNSSFVFDNYPVTINFPFVVIHSKNDQVGLSSISKYNKNIEYYKRDINSTTFQDHLVFEESLEEAMKH